MLPQHLFSFFLVLFLLRFHNAQGNAVWLENIGCGTYPDYIETDPLNSMYLPFVVKLHRCQGAVGTFKPTFKRCVPKEVKELEIVTQNLQTYRYETIKVVNHTSCMGRCTRNATMCNKYQYWNGNECKCSCRYDDRPKKDICCSPKVWSRTSCNCVCPTLPQACPKRKIWSEDTCNCMCKPKLFHRCAAQNLTLDLDTCRCIQIVSNEQANTCSEKGLRLSVDIVVLVCVAEALFIAFGYIVYYILCHRIADEKTNEASVLLRREKNEKNENIELNSNTTGLVSTS